MMPHWIDFLENFRQPEICSYWLNSIYIIQSVARREGNICNLKTSKHLEKVSIAFNFHLLLIKLFIGADDDQVRRPGGADNSAMNDTTGIALIPREKKNNKLRKTHEKFNIFSHRIVLDQVFSCILFSNTTNEILTASGAIIPGQLDPTRRDLFCANKRFFTFTMSCWGIPSVMATIRGISASRASRMAFAAPDGGSVASATFKILKFKKFLKILV